MIITLLIAMLSLLVAGSAFAQEDDPTRPPFGDRPVREHRPIGALIDIIADETGLTPQEIFQAARQDEMTLAEVITANGGNVDAVVAAAVTQAEERLAEGVEAGRITQDRADEMLATLEQSLRDGLNGDLPPRPERRGERREDRRAERPVGELGLRGLFLDNLTEVTGLEGDAIREMLRGGDSFSDILAEAGVDADAFIAEVIADADAQITEGVIEGTISEDQAERLIERLTTFLNERLSD
jgi:hypothetical protein